AHTRSSRRPGHFVWQAIELRSARAARWARAATSAQERSARSGKQGPRHCLEVWSFLSLRRIGESSAGDFTVDKIQKTRRQRVAKMYGQQKRNIIHMSSTAYEQDHSAAAPPSSVMNSRRLMIIAFASRTNRPGPQAGRVPLTSRTIQISKHAPMKPAIR